MKKIDATTITPEQCKLARAFLKWSQEDLSGNVRVTKKTIADFERGHRVPYKRTIQDIAQAFEKEGIRFEETNEDFIVKMSKNKCSTL